MRPRLPAPGEIHLWYGRLDGTRREREALLDLLPPGEAGGARSGLTTSASPAAERRLLSHALLRRLLARYAGVEPAALRFETRPDGKPALAPSPCPGRRPEFSLSRSGARVVVAVSASGPVGADLELLRPVPFGALERAALEPEERGALRRHPPERRARAFLRAWTAKEACAKARPRPGLLDPRRVPLVEARAGVPTRRPPPGYPRRGARWTLETLEPEPGYLAAVAAPRPGLRVRLRTLS